jgi:hypothetical protein
MMNGWGRCPFILPGDGSARGVFERNGVYKDYLDPNHLRGSLKVLDKYSIRYILFEKQSALSYLLEHTPGWKIDYQDSIAILFERARDADPALMLDGLNIKPHPSN